MQCVHMLLVMLMEDDAGSLEDLKCGFFFFLQEEELRKGGEPKYAHLSMELHVYIEVFAPIPECYLRMAHAMDEVKKFLVPVSHFCGSTIYGLFTRRPF